MINAIGPVPSPLDSQSVFNTKAFNLLAQLPGFAEEANATAADMQTNADVAAALITAMALPQFMGTSTSSLAIGTGAKSFATQTGKEWVVGQVVIASSGANYMKGQVAAYDAGTGVLDVNVTSVNGSGTFASWTIGLSYEGLSLAKSGDNSDITGLLGLVGPGLHPVGGLLVHTGTTAPTGFIKATGALLSRTAYANLWAFAQASGNLAANDGAWANGQYSPGNGSTTFRIPDLRGEFLRMWDDGRGIDVGRPLGSAQLDAFQGHKHEGLRTTYLNNGIPTGGNSTTSTPGTTDGSERATTFGTPRTATETRPRNVAYLPCIKF